MSEVRFTMEWGIVPFTLFVASKCLMTTMVDSKVATARARTVTGEIM